MGKRHFSTKTPKPHDPNLFVEDKKFSGVIANIVSNSNYIYTRPSMFFSCHAARRTQRRICDVDCNSLAVALFSIVSIIGIFIFVTHVLILVSSGQGSVEGLMYIKVPH